ncbi:hypothetical protein I5S84_11830 [Pseudomonas putida]|uniref:Uncharacterized protein n=1 Tax=Pseudomonas putida TaxID=303 RepID=A0ABD7BM00_PSEPU|nr:hypothetical protein [Pseudomonas putida]MBH3449537.1 hypothetical protein [Pseudomonas putida]QOD00444.1 hypothetical protein ID616_12475 [Pseudomonas putida]
MKQDRISMAPSDDEFTAMMREFDSAGGWMRKALAVKSAASTPDALKQSSADATGQQVEQNRNEHFAADLGL